MITYDKVRGDDLMVFIGGKSVAFATNHVLSVMVNMVATTNKHGDGRFTTSIPQAINWSVQCENLYTVEEADKLLGLVSSGTPVQLIFGKKSSDAQSLDDEQNNYWQPANGYWQGNAYVDNITINAPTSDMASFSCSFTGTGDLTKITN